MARQKNAPKTLPVSVSDTEFGNITQTNPNVVLSLQDRVINALKDGMRSYINAGRLMRTAIDTEYHKTLNFKGSREWLATLPLSVANSYNMMGAAKVADYAGVSDSYLADVGQLAVYHIGRAINEIEAKSLKAALVGLLGTIRNADNVTAFKAIAEFKRANGLKLTDTDEKALFGAVPKASGTGTVTLQCSGSTEKAPTPTELTVKFRGIAFDEACKVLVHSGVDVTNEKDVEKWFAKLMGTLAAKFEAPTAAKPAKNVKPTASNEAVSPEDAAYMAEDAARLATMNAVN